MNEAQQKGHTTKQQLQRSLMGAFVSLAAVLVWVYVRSGLPLEEFLLAQTALVALFIGFFLGLKASLIFALFAVFASGSFAVAGTFFGEAGLARLSLIFWIALIPILGACGGITAEGIHRVLQKNEMLDGRLEELVALDESTGLEKARRFALRTLEEIARARRYRTTFSIMVVQLAHIKELDDVHGPRVRNLVIRSLAEILRRIKRTEDFLARLGEGEFAYLLPETPREGAATLADRIRERTLYVDVTPEEEKYRRIRLTIRVGIAEYPDDGEDYIPLADSARQDCEYRRG